jgi:hypothetical protein
MEGFKIVSSASYGSTGSGIITDYLLEFSNIFNTGNDEYRFLQDFGGITTLEDCLVHSHHRLNSDIAIKLFKKIIDYHSGDIFNKRYENIFKGQFKEISYSFINEITDIKWKGNWVAYKVLAHSQILSNINNKIFPRLKRFLYGSKYHLDKFVPNRDMYFSNPSSEYFTQCVRKYLIELFCVLDPEKKYKFLYFDQLLPPINVKRYFKYFDNLKIIVMDRDPRDYYIENVLDWGVGWVPKNIDQFIILYRGMRKKLNEESEDANVLRLKFEDSIYKYYDFTSKINSFLDLSDGDHAHPKTIFDPAVSKKNTKLWENEDIDQDSIKKIEDGLSEYCYPY